MRCPKCGTTRTDVLETRKWLNDAGVMRRRGCLNGHRFRTYEVSERLYKTLVKYVTPSSAATIKKDALWKRNRSIVREVVAGAKMVDTARKYHVSPQRVSWVVKTYAPEFKKGKRP